MMQQCEVCLCFEVGGVPVVAVEVLISSGSGFGSAVVAGSWASKCWLVFESAVGGGVAMGVGVVMPSGVVLCGAAVGVGVGVFGSKCGGWSLEFGGWVKICLRRLEVGVRSSNVVWSCNGVWSLLLVFRWCLECWRVVLTSCGVLRVQWWVVWLLEASGGVGVWRSCSADC
ncbi:hypothetical protein LOK49_LG14G00270 [Camellia lanceoleosa]|uniref:Uncharacterized protein n=1 Tax=Camellia lanceoleosa TaxID=1840588 RepID=A0ACC0FC68_9ERIC|nr:hypothetical protein LOK49_LG14G00270 [Camellia lanceoleosa]